MFSTFRRKQRRPDPVSPLPLRSSPSLPSFSASQQVFTFPDELVDNELIRQVVPSTPERKPEKSAPLITRPFRQSFKGPISSIYMKSTPPSSFDNWKTSPAPIAKRCSQKRIKTLPSFNLMVAGSRGAGKTSLIRLLLETSEFSPGATGDQRVAVDRFLQASHKRTRTISATCVEIVESRYDRCSLTVIDTPGLDFTDGSELELSHQLTAIVKYVDTQFMNTIKEESKVVRESKDDRHIHCCIYMINPSTILTEAARRDQSSFPKTYSEATVSQNPPDLVPDMSDGDDSDDEGHAQLNMSQAELRAIKQLASRVNIIPVIAHADSLTDSKLARVKDAVRRGMAEIGVREGVLGTPGNLLQRAHSTRGIDPNTSIRSTDSSCSDTSFSHDAPPSVEDERQSRPVIKLRPSRHQSGRSRSRSRMKDDHHAQPSNWEEDEGIATIRFSAHVLAKSDLSDLMPFAFIAPEPGRLRPDNGPRVGIGAPSDDGHDPTSNKRSPKKGEYVPPAPLKGVFLKKFRWGTVDVLNPEHCDFAALRNTIFCTHFSALKTHTREVLYEKYRTEKLLARRATENISEEAKSRLLEDLGL